MGQLQAPSYGLLILAMAENKAGQKNKGAYIKFYALSLCKRYFFPRLNTSAVSE